MINRPPHFHSSLTNASEGCIH